MSAAALDVASVGGKIVKELRAGRSVRREVAGGRLRIDRALPFVCVMRASPHLPGAEDLVEGLSSYLICSEEEPPDAWHDVLAEVVHELASGLGSVIVLEVWVGPLGAQRPTFRIHAAQSDLGSTTVEALRDALTELAEAEVVSSRGVPAPSGKVPALGADAIRKAGCVLLGLEVPPVFADPETGRLLPDAVRDFQRRLGVALLRAFFEFASVQTSFQVKHFLALGPRQILEAAHTADRQLVQLAEEIDFLVVVTPVNADECLAEFEASNCERAPEFHYRPLRVDPDILKRRLFAIELESVEDPTLAAVFRAKRRELDRLIGLLEDRDSPDFLPGSIQLYGGVTGGLRDLAARMAERLNRSNDPTTSEMVLEAGDIADRAQQELDHYRTTLPNLACGVSVRDDVPGVIVDEGDVLLGSSLAMPAARLDALMAHEIGTHVLTHANGSQQPLRQLSSGLAGYEETQEGLAVLAEHMVGGLDSRRLLTLAARVLAVRALLDGASFVDTFRMLHDECGLGTRPAFTVAMRVYRSGGLTKDAIYLRGLQAVLAYLATGGDIEPLLVGKLPLDDVGVVEELLWREVLKPAALRPRWLDHAGASERLEALREGRTVDDLVAEVTP